MARPLYDSNKENWTLLFSGSQSGSGRIAHFTGARPQFGAGIGGILRSLFRLIPSFLSSPVGQSLVTAGANVVRDVSEGSSVKDSLKSNARNTVRDLTGVGKARRKRKSPQEGSGSIIGFVRPSTAPAKRGKRRAGRGIVRRAFIH